MKIRPRCPQNRIAGENPAALSPESDCGWKPSQKVRRMNYEGRSVIMEAKPRSLTSSFIPLSSSLCLHPPFANPPFWGADANATRLKSTKELKPQITQIIADNEGLT